MNFSYRDGRLVAEETREVPDAEQPQWWRDVRAFVESIKDVPWFVPQGDPDPAWRVFETRAAAQEAALGAAGEAAREAALGAAQGAAWKAAREAAWEAAQEAAREAAWDACLQAEMLAIADL